jgi:uncharacterized protein YdeI (YjbR/CyaY-like superfamily)
MEEWKWRVPCYTFQENNIVMVQGFKEYCAIGFFKGALLSDTESLLIQQTENSQSARQLRFTQIDEIIALEKTIKAYILEAIEIEKAGLNITYKKKEDYAFPEELHQKMQEYPALKTAFEALTPGRQKGYLLHFSEAKQAKTRETRIEKAMPKILDGKGLMDCTCGLSKRMPNCDGSHKQLTKLA